MSGHDETAHPGLREYLLDLGVGQSRPISRAGAVIRSELDHGPEYLAVVASAGQWNAEELHTACQQFVADEQAGRRSEFPEFLVPEGVGAFGSLFISEGDVELVADLYRYGYRAARGAKLNDLYLRICLQSNLLAGRKDFVREVLDQDRHVTAALRWQLELDLTRPPAGDVGSWAQLLNEPVTAHGQSPVRLEDDALAFTALRSDAPAGSVDGPRVTVVMATFQPGLDLDRAVASITGQTWRDLEIIIIDDCSGPESWARLQQIAQTDPRIRVFQMPVNGGTYKIRNRALHEATGDFVTFQDDDDWSHPERIERQVRALLDDETRVASLSRSLRLSEDLHVTYVGFMPMRKNESSLLFRRVPVLERLGGFDTVRKAGDSEFSERLAAVFGPESLVELPDVLAFVQLTSQSLSRGDFRYRWKHPAREEYRHAFMRWHHDIRAGSADPRHDPSGPRPFPAPARLLGLEEPRNQEADIVLVTGLTAAEPRNHGLGHELAALGSSRAVGVLASETARYARMLPGAPDWSVLAGFNSGHATRWSWQTQGRAGVVVVRDPELLMLPPRSTADHVVADRVVLVAGYPPRAPGGRLVYAPRTVQSAAERIFRGPVCWLPATSQIARTLVDLGAQHLLEPAAWGVGPPRRSRPPGRRSSVSGVVGTTAVETMVLDRPTPEELMNALPGGPGMDVRIRDELSSLDKMGRHAPWPASWLVFGPDTVSTTDFMDQLDVYVDFAHTTWGPCVTWSVIAAMARGAVPVVDPAMEPFLGDAAVYATRAELSAVVRRTLDDPDLLTRARDAGARLSAERYTPAAARGLVESWFRSSPCGQRLC